MPTQEELEQKIANCRANGGSDQKVNPLLSPNIKICPYSVGYAIINGLGDIINDDHLPSIECPNMARFETQKRRNDEKTVWVYSKCKCR